MASQVPDGSPTVRGRRLAAELRRLRERTGLTGDEVAQRLGWSGSKVSRIETHRTGVKPADLRRLLDLYGVEDSYGEELLALARESRQRGWLETVTAHFPPEYATHIAAEAEAVSVWSWEPFVVPGLLQTSEYARAVFTDWHSMFPAPPSDMKSRLEARRLRQQVLFRDDPLQFSVVMDESVLSRRFGGDAVMQAQLERLLEASALPNVDLRVLPLNGEHPVATGAFQYLKFPAVHDIPMLDIVSVEHFDGHYYVEDETNAFRYEVAFHHLMDISLSSEETRALVAETIQQVWTPTA